MTHTEISPRNQIDEEFVKLILREQNSSDFEREELFYQHLRQMIKRGANPKITIKGKTLPDILLEKKAGGGVSARREVYTAARILVDAGAEFNDDNCRLAFMREYVNHIDYHRQLLNTHPAFYRQAADQLFRLVNPAHTDIFSLLLENGADPDSLNSSGQTCIFAAIHHLKPELINLLLENGARLDIKDQVGVTPFELARSNFVKDPTDLTRAKIYELIRRETALRCPPEAELHADGKAGELVRVTQNLLACQRITEVFNFSRGVYSRTDENMDKPGIATNIRLFQELQGTGLLAEANAVFKRLTGQEPPVEYRYDAKRTSTDQPLPG